MKTQASLPNLKKPFSWDLVTVLDPRVNGRTLQLWLMVRELTIAKPRGTPDYIVNAVKRVLVSPMVPSDQASNVSARENIFFAVADTRYPPQVVELCFTKRQAELFRKAFAPSEKAMPTLTAREGPPRFKCYVPGCKATSSDMDFIGTHFEQGLHPGIEFEKDKIQIYRINGRHDPAILRTPPPLLVRPSALETLQSQQSDRGFNPIFSSNASKMDILAATAGSKRARPADNNFEGRLGKMSKTDKPRTYARPSIPDSDLVLRGPPFTSQAVQETMPNDVDELVEEYMRKHPVEGEIQAEEQELLCVCLKPEDGRVMIECANGNTCGLQWYHPDCLGMDQDELPGKDESWFCPACLREGKSIMRSHSVATIQTTARKKLKPRSAKSKAQQAMTRDIEELGGATDDGYSDDGPSLPSPSIRLKPWSADMVQSFSEDPENIEDYDLTTLASAKASLRARAAEPMGQAVKRTSNNVDSSIYSSNYKSPNCRSWTAEEEQHLKEVVKECSDAGLAGEALWTAAHPKLLARGVNRPIGGMKMRWCRGLRDQTKIDERRKKNKNLLTAVQKPKTDRDPDAPKKGRFKGKAFHAMNRGSGSNSTTTMADTIFTRPFLLPMPATASFPITAADVFGNVKAKASHKRSASF